MLFHGSRKILVLWIAIMNILSVVDSADTKSFIIPESKRFHLNLVLQAFEFLNYKEYNSSNSQSSPAVGWHLAKDTQQWDICWSWEYSKFSQLGPISPHNRINHIPGSYRIVSKDVVYKTIVELQATFGLHHFNFFPTQFILPNQLSDFKKEFNRRAAKAIMDPRAYTDQNYKKRWLVKSRGHRGVSFFNGDFESLQGASDSMVASCIEPLLVDGYKFDIGLYVAIMSLDPLRIYVYENILVRLCKEKYPKDLNASSPLDSYVVVDYQPPWNNRDLRKYYHTLPSASFEGDNFEHLKSYMEDEHGIDSTEFQRTLYQSIVKLIVGNRHHFLSSIKESSSQNSNSFTPNNFFELWRFDFMVDDDGHPFLMEVNQSPNLKEKDFADGTTDLAMKANLVYDLLSMVQSGIALDSEDDSEIAVEGRYCKAHCVSKLKHMNNPACWSCWNLSSKKKLMLRRAAVEYATRGKYVMIYPETTRSDSVSTSNPMHSFLASESQMDLLQRRYFTSLSMNVNDNNYEDDDGFLLWCVNRDQCHGRGDCVNGKCVCDKAFEGNTCYMPSALGGNRSTKKKEPQTVSRSSSGVGQRVVESSRHNQQDDDSSRAGVWIVVGLFIIVVGGFGYTRLMQDRFKKKKYKY